MGLINQEFRSQSLENPAVPLSAGGFLADMFGTKTNAGVHVTHHLALTVSAVRTCVEIIGSTIAAMPCHVYEQTPAKNGRLQKSIAYDHDLYNLINLRPNPEMTHKTFMETYCASFLLWSNAFAEIQRDLKGDVVALWPRDPSKTKAYRLLHPTFVCGDLQPKGTLLYTTTEGVQQFGNEGTHCERMMLAADVLFVPGLSLDGRVGLDIVRHARELLGASLAVESYGSRFFGNGARSSLIIKIPANTSKEQRIKIRDSYMESMSGPNALKPIVLTGGVDITPISIKPDEGQFTETHDSQRNDVAALYHVPPHLLGQMEKSNRSNLEQANQEFFNFAINPWTVAITQEWKVKLFPDNEVGRPGKVYVIGFDNDALIRPDSAARAEYVKTMWGVGAFSPNDCLQYEGHNALTNPAGDKTFVPVNYVELGITPAVDAAATGPNTPGGNPANPDNAGGGAKPKSGQPAGRSLPELLEARYASVYLPLFKDAFNRNLIKHKTDVDGLYRSFAPVLTGISVDLIDSIATELRVERPPDDLLSGFVKDFIRGMSQRAADWTEESVKPELARAVKAIGVSAYEAVGAHTGKVKLAEVKLN
jgi:HK97 family phage portal protein